MSAAIERRLLQILVGIACIVPITMGTFSILRGAAWLNHGSVSPDLDSHFRYLSGIFLMLGIGFASCIADIEVRGTRFRLLGMMVIAGGLARAWSVLQVGTPTTGHILGLCLELVVVPLLMLWQARVARRAICQPPI